MEERSLENVKIEDRKMSYGERGQQWKKGDPFQLNDYISCNQYDDIIVSLFYTYWEMDYKDDFSHDKDGGSFKYKYVWPIQSIVD